MPLATHITCMLRAAILSGVIFSPTLETPVVFEGGTDWKLLHTAPHKICYVTNHIVFIVLTKRV